MPVRGSNLLVFILVSLRKNYDNFYWINKGAGIFVLISWNCRNQNKSPNYLKIFQDYAQSCLRKGSERSNPRQRFLSALEKSKHLSRIYDSARFPRNHRVYQIKEKTLKEYSEKVYSHFDVQSTIEKFGLDSDQILDHSDRDYASMSSPSNASQYSDDNTYSESSPSPSLSTDSELSESSVDSSVRTDSPFFNFTQEIPSDTVFEHQVSPFIDSKSVDCHPLVPCNIPEDFSEEKFYELLGTLPKNIESSSDFLAPSRENERDFELSSTSDLDMEDFMDLYGVLDENQSNVNDFRFNEENKQKNVGEQPFMSETQPLETVGDPQLLSRNINVGQANPASGTAADFQRPIYYIINVMHLQGYMPSQQQFRIPNLTVLTSTKNLDGGRV